MRARLPGAIIAPVSSSTRTAPNAPAQRRRGGKGRPPSCADCFFGRNGLCALDLDRPCPTFRPDHPEGLVPPVQLQLIERPPHRADGPIGLRDVEFVA